MGRVLLPGFLCLTVGGCCSAAPPVDKYFQRSGPLEATHFLRYAVEARQWEAAYGCLAARTRDQLSLSKFKAMLRWVTIPETPDVEVGEFLIAAQEVWLDERPASSREARVWLGYQSSDTTVDYVQRSIVLIREGDGWQIDLERSVESWQRATGA